MLNSISLMGRLTKDPELRYTSNNIPCCSFTVAVDRDFQNETDFIPVVAWRKTAEFAGKYFTKGMLVAVNGSMQTRSWTGDDGVKRYVTEVVAEHCYFAEKKSTNQPASDPVVSDFAQLEDEDDGHLPF